MATLIYANLSNGVLALPRGNMGDPRVRFLRVQSTACEQKRWGPILQDLDTDFLVSLAMGVECHVIDYGSRRPVPRAIWQGFAFIEYVLERIWFNRIRPTVVDGMAGKADVTDYFEEQFNKLPRTVIKRLKWFRRWLNTNQISITYHSEYTYLDGQYEHFAGIVAEHFRSMDKPKAQEGQEGARKSGFAGPDPSQKLMDDAVGKPVNPEQQE